MSKSLSGSLHPRNCWPFIISKDDPVETSDIIEIQWMNWWVPNLGGKKQMTYLASFQSSSLFVYYNINETILDIQLTDIQGKLTVKFWNIFFSQSGRLWLFQTLSSLTVCISVCLFVCLSVSICVPLLRLIYQLLWDLFVQNLVTILELRSERFQ